jgi:mono/diheme cytochrome c family protein
MRIYCLLTAVMLGCGSQPAPAPSPTVIVQQPTPTPQSTPTPQPTPQPQPTPGNQDGASLYANKCSPCHGVVSDINGRSVANIKSALLTVKAMRNVKASDSEIALISSFLSGQSGGQGPGPGPGGGGDDDDDEGDD